MNTLLRVVCVVLCVASLGRATTVYTKDAYYTSSAVVDAFTAEPVLAGASESSVAELCYGFNTITISGSRDSGSADPVAVYVDFKNNVGATTQSVLVTRGGTGDSPTGVQLIQVRDVKFSVRVHNEDAENSVTVTLAVTLNSQQGTTVMNGVVLSNDIRPILLTEEGHQVVDVSGPTTAFGELRMAPLTPIFQYSFRYGVQPRRIEDESVDGTITFPSADAAIVDLTAAEYGEVAHLRSKTLVRYRGGQGIMTRMTGIFTACATGSLQLLGIGDTENGFFFGCVGNQFGILRRTGGSDTGFVPQTEWNLDRCDGSKNALNPSKFLLNVAKGNVYQIQYKWLGFGSIVFSLEVTDGRIQAVHRIKYSNTQTAVSIEEPSNPLMMFVNNTGGNPVTMRVASIAAFTEGVQELLGAPFSHSRKVTSISDATETIMFSVRVQRTYAGVANRMAMIPTRLTVASEGTTPFTYRVRLNCAPPAPPPPPAYTAVPDNSIVEESTEAYTLDGAIVAAVGTSKVGSKVITFPSLGLEMNGMGASEAKVDRLTVTVETTTGSGAEANAMLSWMETM